MTKFGISEHLFIDRYSFGHRFVPRGENWFLLPDMPILRHRDLGSCLDIDHCLSVIERSAWPAGIFR